MNKELIRLDLLLKKEGFLLKSYSSMSSSTSGKALVLDNTTEAYWFDDIVKKLFTIQPNSMDSLLIKENIYLIEFKRIKNSNPSCGVLSRDCGRDEVIKHKSTIKLVNSITILKEEFLYPLAINRSNFTINAIIVVDSNQFPIMATSSVMSSLSGIPLKEEYYYAYCKANRHGKKLFYDSIKIWNETNFSTRINKLK